MSRKEDFNYYDMFINMSDNILKTTNSLKEVLDNYSYDLMDDYTKRVHEYENNCDIVVHKIMNQLVKEFLPPIDREDISEIAYLLDDVEDSIEEIFIEFKILGIQDIKRETYEFSRIIIDCSNEFSEMFKNFKNLSNIEKIKENVKIINKLESEGDIIYQDSIANLYKNSNDPIEIIKWTNIYNCFETAIDSFEQVADIIEDAVMKNS